MVDKKTIIVLAVVIAVLFCILCVTCCCFCFACCLFFVDGSCESNVNKLFAGYEELLDRVPFMQSAPGDDGTGNDGTGNDGRNDQPLIDGAKDDPSTPNVNEEIDKKKLQRYSDDFKKTRKNLENILEIMRNACLDCVDSAFTKSLQSAIDEAHAHEDEAGSRVGSCSMIRDARPVFRAMSRFNQSKVCSLKMADKWAKWTEEYITINKLDKMISAVNVYIGSAIPTDQIKQLEQDTKALSEAIDNYRSYCKEAQCGSPMTYEAAYSNFQRIVEAHAGGGEESLYKKCSALVKKTLLDDACMPRQGSADPKLEGDSSQAVSTPPRQV